MFGIMLASGQPIVLVVFFWIFLALAVIGAITPDAPTRTYLGPGRWIIVLILIGILGYVALGNPAH